MSYKKTQKDDSTTSGEKYTQKKTILRETEIVKKESNRKPAAEENNE